MDAVGELEKTERPSSFRGSQRVHAPECTPWAWPRSFLRGPSHRDGDSGSEPCAVSLLDRMNRARSMTTRGSQLFLRRYLDIYQFGFFTLQWCDTCVRTLLIRT